MVTWCDAIWEQNWLLSKPLLFRSLEIVRQEGNEGRGQKKTGGEKKEKDLIWQSSRVSLNYIHSQYKRLINTHQLSRADKLTLRLQ